MENEEYFNNNERMLRELCNLVKKQSNAISELKKEVGELRVGLGDTYHKVCDTYDIARYLRGTVGSIRQQQLNEQQRWFDN